jgi:iron complex transport system substrate-binding protein
MNWFWLSIRDIVSVSYFWRLSRILKLFGLGLGATLLVVACSGSTPDNQIGDRASADSTAAECRTIQHDVGEAEVCDRPQKIVALRPYCLDLLLSLNRQPAGYAEVFSIHQGDTFDNPSQQIPYLGDRITTEPINLGTGDEPSLEALTKLKPDLILGEAGGTENIYPLLSQIAPTLLWEQRTTEGKWQQDIQKIAKALGEEERAEKAIAQYNQKVAAARSELAPVVATHPRLLLLGANRLAEGFYAINHDSYLSGLLKELGFELVTVPGQDSGAPSLPVTLEMLPQLARQADTIFVLGYDLTAKSQSLERVLDKQTSVIEKEWRENKITQSLKATREGRVYFTTYYLWNGLNGPIGAELILNELRQILLQ